MNQIDELMELAAKAAGYDYAPQGGYIVVNGIPGNWNPLTYDGDALRLAVKLNIHVASDKANQMAVSFVIGSNGEMVNISVELWGNDPCAAARRAIVRTAAKIGKEM